MSQLLNEIEARRARRALDIRSIEADKIERLFEAAVLAPSCMNKQPWRFVRAEDPGLLPAVRAGLSKGNAWATRAPLIVLVLTKPELDCRMPDGREYAFFDTGMACMNLQLQAEKEGLIAHPIAGFDPAAIGKAIGLGPDWRLVTLIIVGYPGLSGDDALLSDQQKAGEKAPRERKPMGEVVFKDTVPPD